MNFPNFTTEIIQNPKRMTHFNLKTLVAVLLVVATGGQAAGTVLPNFKTADDFGGQNVENLSLFVPTTNNFTLEVEATAGTTVGIGFAHVSYTPTESGTVRFVQQDGVVYIFENNAYVTTQTPQYNYAEAGENIIRNGSFETVAEQMATGRWKAADWDTWDGGTPTWGGDVGYVNVRENESKRSDGTKSIILHSRSKWLCQRLTAGVLEAGVAYLLKCDYWTSDGAGNGNGVYELWLGTSLATNDLLTLEGYTTLEGDYSQQSFATIFQAPQTSSSEIYLSFYREVSKVDWLDNVRLVKITPDGMGITGASKAICRTGAYAPQSMTLPEGTTIDMTASIVNPNFDDATMNGGAPAGWTLDAKATQSKISTAEKWGGVIASDQNHWQIWQDGAALTGRAYQTLTNLPNGRYKLSATVVTTGFGGSIALYANYGKTAVASNAGKTYSTTGVVFDGTLELGLDLATTGGVTLDFDTFTLQYLGMDAEGYREVLALKINEAKTILDNLEEGYDATPITDAIAAAEALGSDAAAEAVIAAIATIDAALADYQVYADQRAAERKAVEQFAALIEAAKAEREADSYPGGEAFDAAIAEAETFLGQLEQEPSLAATAQRDALNAAREIYYNSQYTITPVAQTVSYVDLSLSGSEKYVLRVDGRPFYATNIQVRPDKLRGYEGWSEAEVEAAFKRAADDGFSTLSIPVYWSEVEPEKNHFDWRMLDRYLGWCKKYGVKMELLWFSWSSGGRVQYLWNYGGRQQLRTPDYVCSMEGTSEYNMLRSEWEYSLDWRDTDLRSRECHVLGRVMEHVALWDANNGNPHTVIGVQLGNEARAHGGNTATAAEIIDYYHHVGAAVKQSSYVVWTRLNCVSYETSGRTSANENKRRNGGTNIDFVGIDVYGTSAESVRGDINGQLGVNGQNFRMIMEIDAKDSNSPLYQMAALAGDKAFDYYNLGHVDGNGLYSNNGHTLAERAHIGLVRQRNRILNLANQDIALHKQGSGLYVYNYAGNSTASETGLAGITFTPDAASTQAIAVRHSSSQIALLSTSGGTFTIPTSLDAVSAQKGYFDKDNQWVKEGDAELEGNVVSMPTTSCVLVTLDGAEELSGLVNWGDGTTAAWSSPISGPYNSGSQIKLKGVTVTLGDIADTQTTWSYNSSNGGLIPTQMPSTDGTTGTLVTSFSENAPYGTLPTHGCFLKIEASETGTVSIGCKPSTDAAQQLVFVTMDGDNITEAKVITAIWDSSYSFDVEAGKTYYFFQLAKTGLLTSYRFTLKSVSFLKKGQSAVKVFTIGDSTMAEKSSATERGWGMLFPLFVDAASVTVSNHAADGRSTLSFINEGRWETVLNLLGEGDYVLIQFGHNDEKTDATLHTDPQTTYKQNLTQFVGDTRAKGAHAVLLTPIVRRIFGSDGNILDEHAEYAEAMRELASELDVPLIDMTLLSSQYENIAGIKGSRELHEYFPGSEIDNTHLCQLGAYITARCVAEQIASDNRIGIAVNEKPTAMEGAYSSTLDYAQHTFATLYPDETAASTLATLDQQVRQLRHNARHSLAVGDDATFALVNPDFAEGFCWYNAVQATRPMGWTIDYTGTVNIKTSTTAKPDGAAASVITSGQEHLQLWGINGTVTVGQTISDLPNGHYELTASVCVGGSLTATLFAGNYTTSINDNGTYRVEADITDGTLQLGIQISSHSGAVIDMDDFILRLTNDSGIDLLQTHQSGYCYGIYDLYGRKVAHNTPSKGIYIINGEKRIIR